MQSPFAIILDHFAELDAPRMERTRRHELERSHTQGQSAGVGGCTADPEPGQSCMNLGHVARDVSKVTASASKHKAKYYGLIQENQRWRPRIDQGFSLKSLRARQDTICLPGGCPATTHAPEYLSDGQFLNSRRYQNVPSFQGGFFHTGPSRPHSRKDHTRTVGLSVRSPGNTIGKSIWTHLFPASAAGCRYRLARRWPIIACSGGD